MIQARIRKTGRFCLDVELSCASVVTMLYGPHGAGKTLTLDAIAGLVKPDEGRILADDQILFDGGTRVDLPPALRPIGYIPQRCALFPHMTIRENLLFAAGCRRLPKLERHRRVNELVERFGLSAVSGGLPAQVSGSDRQRAVFARALVAQPRLLLADDPARGLDVPLRLELYDLVRRVWSEHGIAVLVATPAVEDCFEVGEEMLVLAGGKLAQTGPPRQVIDQPSSLEVARVLGGFNLLPAEIVALDPGRKTSRLRLGDADLTGPYFPGRLRGDKVTLCVRPADLAALPASGKPGLNQVPAQLTRVTEMAQTVRLQFNGEIAVEMIRGEYQQRKHHREWVVEFPPERLRVL